jgi:Fe-S-cluster containining protein
MKNKQCKFIKSDDLQCKSHPIRGEDYCFTHHPDYKERHKEAVKRGGVSPKKHYGVSNVVKIRDGKDVVILIEKTINDLRQNKISVKMANSIAILSSVVMKAFDKKKQDKIDDFLSGKGKDPF